MKEIINNILIDAPVSKVWSMLTQSEWTRQYMYSCDVVTDWKPGSTILWNAVYEGKLTTFVSGTVVAFEPETFISYTVFDPMGPYEDKPENHLTVTYTLKDEEGKTRLIVSQGDYTNVPNGEARYEEAAAAGGWESVVTQIKELAEK